MHPEAIDAEQLDIVARRFELDAWRGRNTFGEELLAVNAPVAAPASFQTVRVTRRELPGGVPSGEPPAGPAGTRAAEAAPAVPGALVNLPVVSQAIWRVPQFPAALLRIDLFERESRLRAHDLVIRLLADFESPLVERKAIDVGDVAFGGRREGLLLFARANLVYMVRNIGRQIVPVTEIARLLDARIVRPPDRSAEGAGTVTAPEAPAAGARQAAPSQDGNVEVPIVDRLPSARTSIRVFAPSGALELRAGRIVYCGPAAGARAVRVVHDGP